MRRALVCLCIAALFADSARAQSRARRTREGWTRRVQAGAHVAEGNRDAAQTRVQISAKGLGDGWESEIAARSEVGQLNGKRTRERVGADFLYRRDLSPRAYLANRFEFLYDGIADLDYRVVISPALGWFALREERQQLRLEVGPAGIFERKAGDQEAYSALRLAEYYEARVTRVSRLLQGVEYLPELRAESGAYIVKAFVELKADLDAQLALHVRLESDYDNQPAEGKVKQDTSFSASISYAF